MADVTSHDIALAIQLRLVGAMPSCAPRRDSMDTLAGLTIDRIKFSLRMPGERLTVLHCESIPAIGIQVTDVAHRMMANGMATLSDARRAG